MKHRKYYFRKNPSISSARHVTHVQFPRVEWESTLMLHGHSIHSSDNFNVIVTWTSTVSFRLKYSGLRDVNETCSRRQAFPLGFSPSIFNVSCIILRLLEWIGIPVEEFAFLYICYFLLFLPFFHARFLSFFRNCNFQDEVILSLNENRYKSPARWCVLCVCSCIEAMLMPLGFERRRTIIKKERIQHHSLRKVMGNEEELV